MDYSFFLREGLKVAGRAIAAYERHVTIAEGHLKLDRERPPFNKALFPGECGAPGCEGIAENLLPIVSTDPNNVLSLGSDGGLYVRGSTTLIEAPLGDDGEVNWHDVERLAKLRILEKQIA